jgi:hypothetical protein
VISLKSSSKWVYISCCFLVLACVSCSAILFSASRRLSRSWRHLWRRVWASLTASKYFCLTTFSFASATFVSSSSSNIQSLSSCTPHQIYPYNALISHCKDTPSLNQENLAIHKASCVNCPVLYANSWHMHSSSAVPVPALQMNTDENWSHQAKGITHSKLMIFLLCASSISARASI